MLTDIHIRRFKGLQEISLDGCGRLNAIVGKNNSGKSSVLHAIDMAGLALSINNWSKFEPKIAIKDMIQDAGEFLVRTRWNDGHEVEIACNENPQNGQVTPNVKSKDEQHHLKTVLVLPDLGGNLGLRRHKTPKQVMNEIEQRNYRDSNALDMLYSIKYYAERQSRGLTPESYSTIIDEIRRYFPDIEQVESDRTEDDIGTLTYQEYGRTLDILYSGTGLKHFIDVLLKLTVSGANVILLDEPEMGLHPDLQRRFVEYLRRVAEEKDVQFFMATHSPVMLNYSDDVRYFRISNTRGTRTMTPVAADSMELLLSGMGVRPSDVFNHDLCLMVEGATDVVYWEHIVHGLYAEDFEHVAVAIIQYGGGAAEAVVGGGIAVKNIVPAQKYTFWIHDRDAPEGQPPSSSAKRFENALIKAGMQTHVLNKRELEYYFPESLHVAAQQKDQAKEKATTAILRGDQSQKYRDAAKGPEVCVPTGTYLRRLLKDHVSSKDDIPQEIQEVVANVLIPWKKEITGEE